MSIKEYFSTVQEEVNGALDLFLPKEDEYPDAINKSMRYSIFAGGKRLRPILLLAAAEAVGGTRLPALPFAAAIEMIHTYTLIHDDLPALDNDDLRRKKPTNHKVFPEAISILAGDGLLTIAFEVMSNPVLVEDLSGVIVCRVIHEIASAVGVSGTIGGQVVDILSEEKKIDRATLEYIHSHKTGKMIRAAVRVGGIISRCSEEDLAALSCFSENIGLAFQIVDDVLEVEGTEEDLGKDIGSDIAKEKATYPSILGLQESKELAHNLIEKGIEALTPLGNRARTLKDIASFVVTRNS